MKPIKIISVWNPKGGQGKSMLALSLAAAAVEMGLKPMVVDQDQQGTSLLYHSDGKLEFPVVGAVPKERPDNVDLVIFDHQASDWAVPSTNLLVMPLKPIRDQYATYIDAYTRAKKAGKKIITVVTDGKSQRTQEKSTTEALIEQGAYFIPSNGVFSRAAEDYRTIFDETLNKAYKVKEIRKIINHILGGILMELSEETEKEPSESVEVA